MIKQKRPGRLSGEPHRTKIKSAGENRGSTRPKRDHKGQGRRVAKPEPKR